MRCELLEATALILLWREEPNRHYCVAVSFPYFNCVLLLFSLLVFSFSVTVLVWLTLQCCEKEWTDELRQKPVSVGRNLVLVHTLCRSWQLQRE